MIITLKIVAKPCSSQIIPEKLSNLHVVTVPPRFVEKTPDRQYTRFYKTTNHLI